MGSWTNCRYLLFLLWMNVILVSCVFLFTGGFLLRRQVLEEKSTCSTSASELDGGGGSTLCTPIQPRFSKAVVIIVDALKYEFTLYDEHVQVKTTKKNVYNQRLRRCPAKITLKELSK